MSNTAIQLKKSGASGNTPLDLHLGEVAINYADGKLYYKNDIGSISYITNQDTFGTISANGELLLALSPTDVLTINPGHAQSIIPDSTTRSLSFGVDESQITSFVNKSGDVMTGDLRLESSNVEAQFIIVDQTLYSGLATRAATPLPNLIAQFTGNTTSYVQVNAQNINEFGSGDFVVTADVGHDDEFYIDMGINNSQFDNSVGSTAEFPLDGYLIVQGSSIDQIGGNLVMGVSHTGQDIKFVAGGLNQENIITIIDESGVHITGNLNVDGTITSPTITKIQNTAQAAFNKANAAFDRANTGGGGGGTTTLDNITLYQFPTGDYGSITDPIMVYGGLGDIISIYDMRTEPMTYSVIPIDFGYLS